MQSILLVSQNREKAKEYIDKISRSEKVDPIDVNVNSFEKAIGIEDVRDIRKKIFLTPFKSKTKIAVIEAYEGITVESQNALLKILEEPPNNTIIIIAVGSIGLILPTILSRCKIINLVDKSIELSKQEFAQHLNVLVSLSSSGVGERLKLAQDIAKNKEDIIPELEKMIIVARQQLLETLNHQSLIINHKSSTSQYFDILKSLQKTHTVLKTTNVNPRLTLENLFLNL